MQKAIGTPLPSNVLVSMVGHLNTVFKGQTPSVEEISDVVERLLIKYSYPDAAIRFAKYRESRSRLHEVRPDPSALTDYIIHSKYTREGENWMAAVGRVEGMHIRRFPHFEEEIRSAFNFVRERRVLPSMRSLQFGGVAIEVNHARMYNCSFANITDRSFFSNLMFLLLSGCGVGYSIVKARGLFSYPDKAEVRHHQVEDTIEGWADAIDFLMDPRYYTEFDYSQIRPEGSPLVVGGGLAPGHLPLKIAIEKIRPLLKGTLTAFTVHRICCIIAEAVVAGGVRRSSLMCLFRDEETKVCKANTTWYRDMPELAMANNSYVVYPGEEVDRELFDHMKNYGEPGVVHMEPGWGTNPCGEIGLHPDDGTFAFCNLTEIVGEPDEDTVWAAAFIGTLQATYTDVGVPVSDKYLLGISVTGILDNPDMKLFGWKPLIHTVNKEWAAKFGIEPTERLTTVKPSGTASLLVGCSNGAHPAFAKRTIRRIIANANEPAAIEFAAANPHAVETRPNGRMALLFPMYSEGLTKKDLSAVQHMDIVKRIGQEWVTHPHNVSATITVRMDEWDDVYEWVKANRPRGMSFLAEFHSYEGAPFSENDTLWYELVSKYRPVRYSAHATDLGSACEGGSCEILH